MNLSEQEELAFRNHRIIEDIKAGIPLKTLAEFHKLSESHVYRICFHAGVRPQNRGYNRTKPRKSRIDWNSVNWIHTTATLSRMLGCSYELVRLKRKEFGAPDSPHKGEPTTHKYSDQ